MKDISQTNKISPLVNYQVPEFVRIDHPSFVAFLEAYYEWLEQQGAKLRSPLELKNVNDIDTTLDEFIENFKQQYLLDFPENLAINVDTGLPVEVKTIIKNIKQFYRAKGTEKSFEFLFRILYDTNVEFYYPKLDILRASDGKWVVKKAIRIGNSSGNSIYESIGRKIYQKNASGTVTGAATIIDINQFQIGSFEITELNLNNINGSFNTSYPIEYETSTTNLIEPKVYSVVSSITISNGGSGYKVGDEIKFTNLSGDTGIGAKAKVSQVSSTGRILRIKIENFGANYYLAPILSVISNTGSGFAGTCSLGAICNFEGYYANSDGKLSSNKVLQDNHYFQNYSYVLRTEIVVNRYKEIIKRLIHPAGLGFFGEILIKRCLKSDLQASSALLRFEVPIIGHYAPYTNNTYENFAEYFKIDGIQHGFDPDIHDEDLIQPSQGNPLNFGLEFFENDFFALSEPGFPRADPFWIIYAHPNTRITNPVLARIEFDTTGLDGTTGGGKTDFLNGSTGSTSWSEWTLTGATERTEWAASFTGGFKYTFLKYNTTTPFRKITMGSFFSMPLGEEFDCRYDNGIVTNHGNSPNF